MRPSISFLSSGLLLPCVAMACSAASAQDEHPFDNAFFEFEYVLMPLAVKWACGGQRDTDLSQINALVLAFPEDAERADITQLVTTLNEMASGRESLQEFLGAGLSGRQVAQLCSAALSLNIDWVTPEQLILDDESGIPDEQEAAWRNFFGVVEGFQ